MGFSKYKVINTKEASRKMLETYYYIKEKLYAEKAALNLETLVKKRSEQIKIFTLYKPQNK